MLSALSRSRAVARFAIGGLALGVAALAALALWSTAATARATAQIRADDQVSNQWTQFLLHVSDEYEQLNDYAGTLYAQDRNPLSMSAGSALPALRRLQSLTTSGDRNQVTEMIDVYDTYTETVQTLLTAGAAGDRQTVASYSALAALANSTLRRQAIARLTDLHADQDLFLAQIAQRNRRLQMQEAGLLGVDAVLLLLSASLLFTHQRRIERQAEQSTHDARHDALTGLPNRVLFRDRLDQALREAPRNQETAALLLLDLDRFKEVNDTLGHHHGDLLLRELAARLVDVIRDGDTVARLGGDEFGILLRKVSSVTDALVVAERALEEVRRPADLLGRPVTVGGSIGVVLSPLHGDDGGDLLRLADIAMYEAKRQRSGALLYQPDWSSSVPDRLAAASELSDAIETGQLVLHFQPKLNLQTGTVIGTEALVRWQHPTRGLLGPDAFVALAEESDLILSLTDRVLDLSLAARRNWFEAGWDLSVAVNVGVRSLLVHDLPDRIAAALARHATPPEALVLEITESAFIADFSRAIDVLGQLRDIGVRIAIDDFGTGYSSLTYLQALPADELKIDRGFVGAMLTSSSSEAIVRATLQLGHSLGLEVTAEGIEDDAILGQLEQMGCDLAQGYFICRPVPDAELGRWLQEGGWPVRRVPQAGSIVARAGSPTHDG